MNDREKFYAGFTPLEIRQPDPGPRYRTFKVYLFRAPNCIRGWLSYVRLHPRSGEPTVTVELEATSSAVAKNAAITMANAGFVGLKVLQVNRTPGCIWNADQFPELGRLKTPCTPP